MEAGHVEFCPLFCPLHFSGSAQRSPALPYRHCTRAHKNIAPIRRPTCRCMRTSIRPGTCPINPLSPAATKPTAILRRWSSKRGSGGRCGAKIRNSFRCHGRRSSNAETTRTGAIIFVHRRPLHITLQIRCSVSRSVEGSSAPLPKFVIHEPTSRTNFGSKGALD